MKLILASSSPRRSELLRSAGVSFEVLPPCIDEIFDPSKTPEENARIIAFDKASTVGAKNRERTVLAADTIVVLEGKIIGKPADKADARRILTSLSGKTHKVITCVAMINISQSISWIHAETSAVTFRDISAKMIADYVDTSEPLDKAGGYAIQGGAKNWIERYEGSLTNIIGLPMEPLEDAFAQFGLPSFKPKKMAVVS